MIQILPTRIFLQKFSLVVCFLMLQFLVRSQDNRIDLPGNAGLISMVGNDRYLITDDEEYFLLERMNNLSVLFEIKTGKLKAVGAEAYRLYAEHTNKYPIPNYTVNESGNEFSLYEGSKKLYSIKKDPYKNEVKPLKKTGIVMELLKKKDQLVFVHPDGRRVELADHYSNMEKKDPKRNIHHRTVFANLDIGYYFITRDLQYVFDRDGRVINLQTGEAFKMDHNARHAHGNVYGSYDPETTILKIDDGGSIKAYHLRTQHYLGRISYSHYLDGQFIFPVSIPLLSSNSQLCVVGLGYSEAQVYLITDNKVVHAFTNPNVLSEKNDYAMWQQKREEENRERLKKEEAVRQWNRDHLVSRGTLTKCNDCNGTGMLGRTAKTTANQMNVYEKRGDNYYFRGTSHDTWPIICGSCFGRGSSIKK